MAPPNPEAGLIARTFKIASKVEPNEISAVIISFVYLFCVMSSYNILRPVRDAMALASNTTDDLPWLFTATFLSSLVAVPIYSAISSKYPPSRFLPWVYAFFAANLLAFYLIFLTRPESVPAAYTFYVWISVFNLFVISVFWSFMANLFSKNQARRLFGFIAAGGSAGAAAGPLITSQLVEEIGTKNLMLISASLLLLSILFIRILVTKRGIQENESSPPPESDFETPLGGHFLSGFSLFAKSPYLLGIGLFILLYTSISTFLYFIQGNIIIGAFETTAERTKVFAYIDLTVNTLAILTQLFGTARLATRFGLVATLALIPVLMIAGFLALSIAPTLGVFLVIQICRRAGNYAITRPAREMLFTIVDKESKYKAKNLIDTVIYRGGDLASAWIFTLLGYLGLAMTGIAVVASGVAAVWALIAALLGRSYETRHSAIEAQLRYKEAPEYN